MNIFEITVLLLGSYAFIAGLVCLRFSVLGAAILMAIGGYIIACQISAFLH